MLVKKFSKLLILTTIIGSFPSWGKVGFCEPIKESKKYIEADFSAPYPKEVIFKCRYKCHSERGEEQVEGISRVTVRSMTDDARLVVCQGVKVKKVSWGYDFDKVVPFYAYKTNMKRIKEWAFTNIIRNNPTEKKLLTNLRNELISVANSYSYAGASNTDASPAFAKASEIIMSMASPLPDNTDKLDQKIQDFVDRRGEVSQDFSAENLVINVISSLASWRVPSHLY